MIPCYKAEHTLRQTVESVLQGAPDNLQLVLVEDGSPDGTGALCDALAAQDPRVTALHQPNGGASAARNAGLDTLCRSGAEWVLFVDADDTLLPGLWQALPAAFDAQPGLILYGMVRASGSAPNPLAPGCYAGPAALGDALDPLLFESGYLAAPYPKLFRLDVIRRNKLRFDPRLKINEDVLFNLQYLRFLLFLQKNSAIYCLAGVYYNQNDMLAGSLSRSLRGGCDPPRAGSILDGCQAACTRNRPPGANKPGACRVKSIWAADRLPRPHAVCPAAAAVCPHFAGC